MKWSSFQESWLMGSDDKNNVVFFDARSPEQIVGKFSLNLRKGCRLRVY